MTDLAKGTLLSSGTPFSNLKASSGQDSPSGYAPSPTLSGPWPGRLTHLFTGRSRNLHPRTWPEPGPLPDLQPPERSQPPPARGGLGGPRTVNPGRSGHPPPPKKARRQRGVLCLGFQQFRFPWTAPGRRIPSGHKESTGGFDLGRAGSASASPGGL